MQSHFVGRRLTKCGVAGFIEKEGVIAATFVDDVISGPQSLAIVLRVSPGLSQSWNSTHNCRIGMFWVKELSDYIELEAFNVHLEQVEVMISIAAHNGGQVIAIEGDFWDTVLHTE